MYCSILENITKQRRTAVEVIISVTPNLKNDKALSYFEEQSPRPFGCSTDKCTCTIFIVFILFLLWIAVQYKLRETHL